MIPWWPGGPVRHVTCTGWRPASAGSTMPWAARPARDASSSPRAAGPVRAAGSPVPNPRPLWSLRRTGQPPVGGRMGDGRRYGSPCPGRFNQANALMAAVAAEACGVDALEALAAMAAVQEVAGRFTVRAFGAARARLMLAKNPAGWDELLDLVAASESPLVVSINARVADGADPSWLWDVPYERLAGRAVVATGDRFRDLSVRLHYGGVAHTTEPEPVRRRHSGAPPGRTGWSMSSGTTPLSTICSVLPDGCSGAHRRRLPRPVGHLRRRRERSRPGAAGRMARPRGHVAASLLGPATARGRRVLPGRGRGRSPGPRRPDAHRRRHAGAARRSRRRRAGRLRGVPGGRAELSGGRRAMRTRVSACWTSTR